MGKIKENKIYNKQLSNKPGIYKITNTINNKIYYGSAKKLRKRHWDHFNNLKKGKHDNPYLQSSFNYYGEKNFIFNIVLFCDINNLIFYEQKFLDKYFDNQKNCYNICPTAGSCLNKKLSEETKMKISKANKGKNNPMYGSSRTGKQNPFYGKKHTKTSKEKMSKARKGKFTGKQNPFYGKKHDVNTKKTISEMGKDKNRYVFYNENLSIKEKMTQFDFRVKYNLKQPSVSALIKGRLNSLKGWKIKN